MTQKEGNFICMVKGTRFSSRTHWFMDQNWISPVQRKWRHCPFTREERWYLLCFFPTKTSSGLQVSSFSKVNESQMFFEPCWHLTESQHHGNNSKEQNTSQVLVDLLSGAPGALLIIGVKVEMVCSRSGKFLHRQTHPAVTQDANRDW